MLLYEAVHVPQRLEGAERDFAAAADVYVCVMTPDLMVWAMGVADQLRVGLPGLRIRIHAGGGKLKSQLKRADASGAFLAVLVGEEERSKSQVSVKFLREETLQQLLSPEALIELLKNRAIATTAVADGT